MIRHLATLKKVCNAVGDIVDIIRFDDDLGMSSGPFMDAEVYRELFKPRHKILCDYVKSHSKMHNYIHSYGSISMLMPDMIEECHKHKLPVIYHGCSNVSLILENFIEMGLDAYNPLVVKANMDAVKPKNQFGDKMGFGGNNDIQVWETKDKEYIKREILKKLNAAKRGGFIFQSRHSVSSVVSGQTYDNIVKLVREYGKYPFQLGEFDLEI